jgi:hypothetical protein
MADLLSDPEHWRKRASEARARAEGFDAASKAVMLGIAESYDQLARHAERHLAASRKGRRTIEAPPGWDLKTD